MNGERNTQWLGDHLDNIRAILRMVGKELVECAPAPEDPRCEGVDEYEYDNK